jgi:hypothetical protein
MSCTAAACSGGVPEPARRQCDGSIGCSTQRRLQDQRAIALHVQRRVVCKWCGGTTGRGARRATETTEQLVACGAGGMLAPVAATHGVITRPCRRAGARAFSAGAAGIYRTLPFALRCPSCVPLLLVSVLPVLVPCLRRLPREPAHSSPTSHHRVTTSSPPRLSRACVYHTRVPAVGAAAPRRLVSPTLSLGTSPRCARSGSCSHCRRAS